jgi:hypothetical protein
VRNIDIPALLVDKDGRPPSTGTPPSRAARWARKLSVDGMEEPQAEAAERETLCLPDFSNGDGHILQSGDPGFKSLVNQFYPSSESNATERLVKLKAQLRTLDTQQFWAILMKEMCDILGAQCGIVAKRILVDDQDSAVEMPLLGEPGSCLLGVAFYLNDDNKVEQMHHDYKYHAYGR